jgi:putative SOS response-associated peptidase YedK
MSNLYSVTTSQEAIRALAKALGEWRDSTGNLQPLPAVFPDQMAPVVRTTPDGAHELVMMRWGFPSPTAGAGPALVTNVRNSASHWWRPWLAKPAQRCLVPVTSFCEYLGHRPAVPHWFAQDEARSPFFFAGIWRTWQGNRGPKSNSVQGNHILFSFLTTEPNDEVKPIHPKAMPVLLLDQAARETWLRGSVEQALALQRPAANGAVRVVATGSNEDCL